MRLLPSSSSNAWKISTSMPSFALPMIHNKEVSAMEEEKKENNDSISHNIMQEQAPCREKTQGLPLEERIKYLSNVPLQELFKIMNEREILFHPTASKEDLITLILQYQDKEENSSIKFLGRQSHNKADHIFIHSNRKDLSEIIHSPIALSHVDVDNSNCIVSKSDSDVSIYGTNNNRHCIEKEKDQQHKFKIKENMCQNEQYLNSRRNERYTERETCADRRKRNSNGEEKKSFGVWTNNEDDVGKELEELCGSMASQIIENFGESVADIVEGKYWDVAEEFFNHNEAHFNNTKRKRRQPMHSTSISNYTSNTTILDDTLIKVPFLDSDKKLKSLLFPGSSHRGSYNWRYNFKVMSIN